MAPEPCPACLDLDYDNYAATPGLEGVDQSLQRYPLPRYRIVPRLEVAAAADAGCDLCRVLREGMLHFWGDQAPQEVDPRPHGIDLDDIPEYNDDDGDDGNDDDFGGGGGRRGSEQKQKEGGGAGGGGGECSGQEPGSTDIDETAGPASSKEEIRTQPVMHHDDDEIRKLHHNICIELRPEGSLTVTWIGPLWRTCYMSGDTQPRLDFFTDTGKLCLP